MGTHFSFLFSIYSENHGVQAVQLNFSRSSDITYVQCEKKRWEKLKVSASYMSSYSSGGGFSTQLHFSSLYSLQ